MKYQAKKQITLFILLLSVTYMVSYIARVNLGAVLVEMERAGGFSKSALALALTGSFITYGLGQVVSGVLGDRIAPKMLVTAGLVLTAAMNGALPFAGGTLSLVAVWCVNGFAQSLLWPPMVKMMSAFLEREQYNNAVTRVNFGSSLGTVLVYLLAPLAIADLGVRGVFFASALMGAAMAVIWGIFAPNPFMENPKKFPGNSTEQATPKGWVTPLLFGVMAAVVLQGMLRDGVTSWMPTYVAETYSLSSGLAIVSGVVLPLFAMACYGGANALHKKKVKNPVACATLFFALGGVSVAGLCLSNGRSLLLSVVCSALLTGSMHGVNLLLVCMVPAYFEGKGKVATVSGVINGCSYLGSALSTYGIALVCQGYGWPVTLILWGVIALAGTCLCALLISRWKKQME